MINIVELLADDTEGGLKELVMSKDIKKFTQFELLTEWGSKKLTKAL